MFEKGDLLKLNNNEEYIVANTATLDNNLYLYLVSKDGISSFKICQLNNDSLIPVIDARVLEKLFEIFREV